MSPGIVFCLICAEKSLVSATNNDFLMALNSAEGLNVADQISGIEAPAAVSYDQARVRRSQGAVLATNYRTERPVVATYVIEYLWQRLGPRLEEFELQPIDESFDTIGQICEQISDFLTPMVREIVSAMASDPDPRIRAYYAEHKVLLEMTAMPSEGCPACDEGKIVELKTPPEDIISNLLDGNRVVWSLMELVAYRLLMDLRESGSLTFANLDGMQRDFVQIIDGKQFLRFVLKIGFSGFLFENAFLSTVTHRIANEDTPTLRVVIDPNFFEFVKNGEGDTGKVLKMRESVRERVISAYEHWQTHSQAAGLTHKAGDVKGCPAGSTNVDGSNVMVEFVKWLIEIAKIYYIPAFVGGVKKEMQARSA